VVDDAVKITMNLERHQVTSVEPGETTGYDPGQTTGYEPGLTTGYEPGLTPRYEPGIAFRVSVCGSWGRTCRADDVQGLGISMPSLDFRISGSEFRGL
jgi:hypothetical protein